MSAYRVSRRSFTATATGLAAGIFAMSRPGGAALAQDATPAADVQPIGYVSMRIRTVAEAAQRELANQFVRDQFAPDVAALEGFQGYLIGDVIDVPEDTLSIVVLDDVANQAGFNEAASAFVEDISDEVQVTSTTSWEGDLLILGTSGSGEATPAADATPAGATTPGYVAVRAYTSLPDTDPREFVPLVTSEFVPIVSAIPGFQGYLFFPVEGGFVSVSLFDTEESATTSNEEGQAWAAENLADYTDSNPEIINANVVYANLPILG